MIKLAEEFESTIKTGETPNYLNRRALAKEKNRWTGLFYRASARSSEIVLKKVLDVES